MTTLAIGAIATSVLTVKLSITVADPEDGETMTVTRRTGAASPVAVMGASDVAAATTIITDPEAPLNRASRWTVTTSSGATIESDPVTLAAELAAISDPIVGVLGMCAVVDRDALSRAQRATMLTVEGDPTPWVVWDVPVGRTMPVQLLTLTPDAEAAVDQILSTGGPVLLRCVCGNHSDRWIQPIGDATTSARVVAKGSNPSRLWDLGDCVVYANNPLAAQKAKGSTLGDVYDFVSTKTLGAIADTWDTLGAIAEADF